MLAHTRSFVVMVYATALIAYLTIANPSLVRAADQPAGTRPATAADIGWMTSVGIPNPKVGMLINPNDPNVGQAVGQTKQWLQQHATKGANISCMNPQFAEKLKKLMEAVPGGPPTITSAYRSQAEQQAIINRGDGSTRVTSACGSYHPWGLAADFNNNARQTSAWMRANARNFGIGTIGEWDFNHFQDAQGRYGQCGVCNSSGGDGTKPNTSNGNTPSSPLDNAIRQALGQQPPPPPPPPPPQTPPQSPSPQQPTVSPTQNPVSNLINTNTSGTGTLQVAPNTPTVHATNTLDLIDQYANPVSDSIDIGTGTPIALNPNTSDAVALDATQKSGARATGTIVMAQPPSSPQTFTSGDLANSDLSPNAGGQNSFLLQLLDTMRNTLYYALNYLKPFGGNIPWQTAQMSSLE